jgi:hypothetical protein
MDISKQSERVYESRVNFGLMGNLKGHIPESEIRRIIKENPELKEEVKSGHERVKRGDAYWSLLGTLLMVRLSSDARDPESDMDWLTGNYFLTKEECQFYREYLLAVGKVRLAILEKNGGWRHYPGEEGLELYCTEHGLWHTTECSDVTFLNILPRIGDTQIAEEIIRDYKDELEIIKSYLSN